ncbi:MAG: ribonuclease HII, partial [Actinomycetia bacterium]|nr:ribonuclease HII [Actinomycetes bacterium]
TRPSLRREKAILRDDVHYLAGCDEVGRGALAGPVSVGVVVIDATVGRVPKGRAGSKVLTATRREALVPAITRWVCASAVGHASPGEIDQWGLTRALRLAGMRALQGLGTTPDALLLDGSFDWLTPPHATSVDEPGLWELDDGPSAGKTLSEPAWPDLTVPPVVTQVKADLSCASVAAASVLAKTTRDAMMVELAATHPNFGWEENKGYASEHHRDQLRVHGPCEHHRRSWRLGVAGPKAPLNGPAGGVILQT